MAQSSRLSSTAAAGSLPPFESFSCPTSIDNTVLFSYIGEKCHQEEYFMSNITKIIFVSVISLLIWSAGLWAIYQYTWAPKSHYSGYSIQEVPMKMTASGKLVEMSFIEARVPHIFALTLFCGGIALFGILLILKKKNKL